jgi:hypothetical protein
VTDRARVTPRASVENISTLGAALAKGAPEAPPAAAAMANSAIGAALAGGVGRVFRDVTVPGIGPAKLRLLDHREQQEVNVELASWLAQLERDRGVHFNALAVAGGNSLTAERAVRTLAHAVREPGDVERPLGSSDEWARLGAPTISAVWSDYEDLVEALDPFSDEASVDPATRAAYLDAVKKKDRATLCTFGARTLAILRLSSDDPPASSETST